MRALILSKLVYGNALLSGCKVTNIAHLQRIQNKVARIVFQVPRRHPSSELLDSLHWLQIEKRIIFKILLHIYKSLNDLSTKYLTDCFKIYIPPREGLRSALDKTRLVVPRTNRLIGDRSFSVRRSILWNNIPPSIRVSTTVCSFQKSQNSFKLIRYFYVNILAFCCSKLYYVSFCVKRFDQFWILRYASAVIIYYYYSPRFSLNHGAFGRKRVTRGACASSKFSSTEFNTLSEIIIMINV